jgi:prolyl-tRNA synthetase
VGCHQLPQKCHGKEEVDHLQAERPSLLAVLPRWVQSYRAALLFNQWANVVRWELRPRLFLRTSEFLWQEGHTARETEEDAAAETLTILHDVYADTIENVLVIPVLRGRKSESERFPGAVDTYTLEAPMRDGKALQAATSRYLGQGFARTARPFTARPLPRGNPRSPLLSKQYAGRPLAARKVASPP